MSQHTFVIAEAGSCHDGDLANAQRLIEVAEGAGADACKFQYWSSAKRLAKRRNAHFYKKTYEKYQMPKKWLPSIQQWCEMYGIEFMCTVYLPEDIKTIAPYVKRFKVASFEAGDAEFVRAHKEYGKPIIISTGMSTHSFTYHLWAYPFVDLTYLHCVSAYPCPTSQANLGAIPYGHGYSDHTASVLTGALAVAAGAKILEVHFRLDDTDPTNPDYKTALSPKDLTRYIKMVRVAETMMGDGIKRPQPCEDAMSKYRVGT